MSASTTIVLALLLLLAASLLGTFAPGQKSEPINLELIAPEGCSAESNARQQPPEVVGSDQQWSVYFLCPDYSAALYLFRYNEQAKGKEATASSNDAVSTRRFSVPVIEHEHFRYSDLAARDLVVAEFFIVAGEMTANRVYVKLRELIGLLTLEPVSVTRVITQISNASDPIAAIRHQSDHLRAVYPDAQVLDRSD